VTAEGVHNLAFQLWLVRGETVEPAGVLTEVMVWIANQGMTPAGAPIDSRELGGEFELLGGVRTHLDRGVERTWTILTATARRPQMQGPIDLGSILRALTATGHLDPDSWLANVDLGTEIVAGSGRAVVRDYRIEVD
jgi:hypothetical protein